MGDGLITSPTGGDDFGGEMNKSWDGIWLARVRRTAIGWTAEIEIPFKTVNFDPDTDTWGANFQRTVKRKNEESLWTGWLRDEGLTRMSNAGRIGGIDGISQGIGLDLKPYVLGSASAAPGRNVPATTGDYDIGLDAFYNLTPALKANFSVNTDFAETEVDERRTNLTRFPLFFEEKREFFLDGANFFEFPGGDESPFFSRRIGLNAGTPQPIVYGAKLVGQASRYDIGVLQVRTSEEEITGEAPFTLKGEDFTVARVKRRFGSQSHAGVLYTRRATHESIVEPRHTAAADVTIATPDFIEGSTLDSGAWYVAYLQADLPHRRWRAFARGPQRFVRLACERVEGSVQRRSVVQGSAARLQRGGRFHAAAELPELESRVQLGAALRESPVVPRHRPRRRGGDQPGPREPRHRSQPQVYADGARVRQRRQQWSSRSSSKRKTWTRTSRSATG